MLEVAGDLRQAPAYFENPDDASHVHVHASDNTWEIIGFVRISQVLGDEIRNDMCITSS